MKIWIIKFHNSQGTDVAPYFNKREPDVARLMKEQHPLLREFVPDRHEDEWVEIVGPFEIPTRTIVEVSGGVATTLSDPSVEVFHVDWDDINNHFDRSDFSKGSRMDETEVGLRLVAIQKELEERLNY